MRHLSIVGAGLSRFSASIINLEEPARTSVESREDKGLVTNDDGLIPITHNIW